MWYAVREVKSHSTEGSAHGEAVDKPIEKKHLFITVADQEGDTEKVNVKNTDTLASLLRLGLDELYSKQNKNAADYDIVMTGVAATDLSQTVSQAGLRDGSEVVIAPKDVSRG